MEELPSYLGYAGMGVLALIPIYFGSFASLPHPHKPTETEVLSKEDAYWFPILGSGVLLGFYLLFHFCSKELVDLLILVYFSIVGTATVYHLFAPLFRSIVHAACGYKAKPFESETAREEQVADDVKTDAKRRSKRASPNAWKIEPLPRVLSLTESILEPFEFKLIYNAKVIVHGWLDNIDVVTLACAVSFMCYYNYSKNWIASNVLAESFGFAAIQWMQIDTFATGMILLAGLFVYDIFWVFATDVMVTVATSLDAPIKILFPRDIFAAEYAFSLLGLGDIVIPGIFVALCLRYDHARAGKPEHRDFDMPYFYSALGAYVVGLATTVGVMHTFKAAQPALLYLSPACILSVLVTGAVKADLHNVFKFGTDTKKDSDTPDS